MASLHTKRRKRRREKLRLEHGDKAVRKHTHKGGRTGQIREKSSPGKAAHYTHKHENPLWRKLEDWKV